MIDTETTAVQTYRIAVKVNEGRPEYVRHVTEDELPARREAIRASVGQPGDVIDIRVMAEK